MDLLIGETLMDNILSNFRQMFQVQMAFNSMSIFDYASQKAVIEDYLAYTGEHTLEGLIGHIHCHPVVEDVLQLYGDSDTVKAVIEEAYTTTPKGGSHWILREFFLHHLDLYSEVFAITPETQFKYINILVSALKTFVNNTPKELISYYCPETAYECFNITEVYIVFRKYGLLSWHVTDRLVAEFYAQANKELSHEELGEECEKWLKENMILPGAIDFVMDNVNTKVQLRSRLQVFDEVEQRTIVRDFLMNNIEIYLSIYNLNADQIKIASMLGLYLTKIQRSKQ